MAQKCLWNAWSYSFPTLMILEKVSTRIYHALVDLPSQLRKLRLHNPPPLKPKSAGAKNRVWIPPRPLRPPIKCHLHGLMAKTRGRKLNQIGAILVHQWAAKLATLPIPARENGIITRHLLLPLAHRRETLHMQNTHRREALCLEMHGSQTADMPTPLCRGTEAVTSILTPRLTPGTYRREALQIAAI